MTAYLTYGHHADHHEAHTAYLTYGHYADHHEAHTDKQIGHNGNTTRQDETQA